MLDVYADLHRLGWAFRRDTAYECFPPTPSRITKADTSFVRAGRLPGEQLPGGDLTLVPDLVVEVVSTHNTVGEVEHKVRQFPDIGVRLIWVVFSETRDARLFRAGGLVSDIKADGLLDGADVLPCFRLRLGDLFPAEPAPPPPRSSRREKPPWRRCGGTDIVRPVVPHPLPLCDGAHAMDQKLRESLATQEEYLKKNQGKLYQTSEAGPVRLDLVRALIETVERLENEVAELKRSIAP